jgi:hypothetical protein
MNDRILEEYIRDFAEQHNLNLLSLPELFEMFTNYCIVSRQYPESFAIEDIAVGGGNDTGIDGVAILVNGRLVTTEEEIDDLRKTLGTIDVQFILIQSKTSPHFNTGEIATFLYGAKSFFNVSNAYLGNDDIERFRALKEHIYRMSIHMSKNPTCDLYYVTTGEWHNPAALLGIISDGVASLEATHLFDKVNFSPVDAAKLKQIYQELNRRAVKEIEFPQHTILPKIDGVRQAYIGILPCREYLKLICDSDGNLQRSVFYDNIRDYQGDNPVNLEIASTFSDTVQQGRLTILNNGITIVAKSINQTGTTFRLQDYQIVNGCQTSHVLYNHRNELESHSALPIKLIETTDLDVTNLITKATNRQTEVKIEAFEALSPFHKRLEEFYTTFNRGGGLHLYYERRSKQYEDTTVKKHQVVTIASQVKCFIGVFLDEPHSTHRYYGEILKVYEIFREKHNLHPYYASALLVYSLEQLILTGVVSPWWRPFRYHIALLYRLRVGGLKTPPLSARKDMDQYCERLYTALADKEKSKSIFQSCIEEIQNMQIGKTQKPNELVRLRAFTSEIKTMATRPKFS